ncbi:MAG: hypothetical protein JWP52_2385 [Rhizobacter sp.]|nr:hypothetical protein [Rhizobacter sp.]
MDRMVQWAPPNDPPPMATLKLKKSKPHKKPARAPVRGAGSGVKPRPTFEEVRAQRAEREARQAAYGEGRPQDRRPDEVPSSHRPPSGAPRNDRPYGERGFNQQRNDRPQGERNFGGPRNDRPHAERGFNQQRDDRPQGERNFGGPRNDRPYGERGFNQQLDDRPQGERNFGGPRNDQPYGERSFNQQRDDRPQGERNFGGPRNDQPYGERSFQQRPTPSPAFNRNPNRAFEAGRPRDDNAPRPAPRPIHAPGGDVPGAMRLSKRMSELGLASRREADEWIEKGWVRVDGRVVSTLGVRVGPDQAITLDAKAQHQQAARVTVLLNKPVGLVSGQAEDGYEPAVVLFNAENQWEGDTSGMAFDPLHHKYLAPAGRLDIDSVGMLVLTQDGRVARQLIGEGSEVEKEYLVRVEYTREGTLPESDLALLNHGLELDEEPLLPARVEWINEDQLRFVLREGKKRQIRRMCEAVGLNVLGLKRVRIGNVMLGHLPEGKWRYLVPGESFV